MVKGMKGLLVILSICSIYSLSEGAVCKDKLSWCQYFVNTGYCVANQWVQTMCKLSCGICTQSICKDKRRDCTWFKSHSFCHEDWMQSDCKKTCNLCGTTATTNAPTTKPTTTTEILCEGMRTSLRCFDGVLNIITATFGRQDTNTCSRNNAGSTWNTQCTLIVTKHIKFFCQNKALCVIYASAGRYGDPCPGTSKYLKINYKCGVKGTYIPPTKPSVPSVPTAATLPPIATIPTTATNPLPRVCGISKVQQSRVINGVDAKAGAWPWQIAMYSSSDDFMCGGTLLNPFWIVTAAHCVNRDPNPSSYYIVLGDTDRRKIEGYERKYGVAKIIVHKGYDRAFGIKHDNDIAMMKLDRPTLFNEYVSPACLQTDYTDDYTDDNCFITGWGKIVFPGYSHTMLQQAKLKLVGRRNCQTKLDEAPGSPGDKITRNMICANGNNGESSGCQGDSGGPLVCQDSNGKWVLRGIVSWGSARCKVGDMYSVFVNVRKYVNWIKNVMSHN